MCYKLLHCQEILWFSWIYLHIF